MRELAIEIFIAISGCLVIAILFLLIKTMMHRLKSYQYTILFQESEFLRSVCIDGIMATEQITLAGQKLGIDVKSENKKKLCTAIITRMAHHSGVPKHLFPIIDDMIEVSLGHQLVDYSDHDGEDHHDHGDDSET